jgi:cytochrome c oxidase assembly protein subunit 15
LEEKGTPRLRVLTVVTTAAIYVQILLGAIVRHTGSGLAIPDFPLAFGRLVPPFFTQQIAIQYAHRLGALTVTLFALWTAAAVMRRHGGEPWLARPAVGLASALVVQILLGAETIWSGRAVVPATLHVAGGAVILALSVILTLRAYRLLQADPARRSARLAHAGPVAQ